MNKNIFREVFNWINEEVENVRNIRTVDLQVLEGLIEDTDDLLVVFYDATKKKHVAFIDELNFKEDDDGDDFLDDQLTVKLESPDEAKKYDLYNLPAVVHYDEGVPNVFDDDLTKVFFGAKKTRKIKYKSISRNFFLT